MLLVCCRFLQIQHIKHLSDVTHSQRVDDIEDDSQLRRGEPVAHKIYGIPQTINTANYVFFLAYQELFKLRDEEHTLNANYPPSPGSVKTPDLDAIVNEELLSLHRGQGLELLWRDSLTCPSEEEYISMVNNSPFISLLI
jgi:geranylgeranyl diphosphate synthase, type III